MSNLPGAVPPVITSPGAVGEIRDHVRPEATDRLKRREATEAGRRLERLEFGVNVDEARASAAYAAVSDFRAALGDAQGHLARVIDPERSLKHVTADEFNREKRFAEEAVEKAKRAYDEAIAHNRAETKAANIARRHLAETTWTLAQSPSASQVELPKIKGDPDAVIADVDAEIRRVKSAPRPAEEVAVELIGQIDSWAADARLRITFGKRPTIGVPVVRVAAEPSGDEIPHALDPRPWLARFHRDELVADIKAKVGEQYKDIELALSERDKRKRLAELADQRLEADRVRCHRIWEAFEAGKLDRLAFPPDADPRAILGIDGPRRPTEKERDERD